MFLLPLGPKGESGSKYSELYPYNNGKSSSDKVGEIKMAIHPSIQWMEHEMKRKNGQHIEHTHTQMHISHRRHSKYMAV